MPYFCKVGKRKHTNLKPEFSKDNSVFKGWADNKNFLDYHDFPKWKTPKVMKNKEKEIDSVKQFIRDKSDTLKDIFMHL